MKFYLNTKFINFSLSTFFIMLLVSSFLILVLNLLLKNQQGYKYFRTDFIFIFSFATILRLCFPFEYFFTVTIPAPAIMNPVQHLLDTWIFGMTVGKWLLIIDITGMMIQIFRYGRHLYKLNTVCQMIIKIAKIASVGDYLPNSRYSTIPVYVSDHISSPMVIGFRKAVFLPEIEFKKEELLNIMEHELTHLRNKDMYIKCLINMLTIIYWWFPLIYILQNQIDLFLEIRVDDKVTGNYSEKKSLQYAETLISVQKKVVFDSLKADNSFNSFMIDYNFPKSLDYM